MRAVRCSSRTAVQARRTGKRAARAQRVRTHNPRHTQWCAAKRAARKPRVRSAAANQRIYVAMAAKRNGRWQPRCARNACAGSGRRQPIANRRAVREPAAKKRSAGTAGANQKVTVNSVLTRAVNQRKAQPVCVCSARIGVPGRSAYSKGAAEPTAGRTAERRGR